MGLLLKSLPFLHSGAEGVSGHQGEKGDIPLPTWGVGAVPEALNAVSSTAWGQRRSVRGWSPSPSAPLALGALGYLGNDFSTPGGLGIQVLPAAPSTLQSGN